MPLAYSERKTKGKFPCTQPHRALFELTILKRKSKFKLVLLKFISYLLSNFHENQSNTFEFDGCTRKLMFQKIYLKPVLVHFAVFENTLYPESGFFRYHATQHNMMMVVKFINM